jgi:hypothetical protein
VDRQGHNDDGNREAQRVDGVTGDRAHVAFNCRYTGKKRNAAEHKRMQQIDRQGPRADIGAQAGKPRDPACLGSSRNGCRNRDQVRQQNEERIPDAQRPFLSASPGATQGRPLFIGRPSSLRQIRSAPSGPLVTAPQTATPTSDTSRAPT